MFGAISALHLTDQNHFSKATSCQTPNMWIRGEEDPRFLMVSESLYLTVVHHTQINDAYIASPTLIHHHKESGQRTWTDYQKSHHRNHHLIQVPQESTKNWLHLKDLYCMTYVTTSIAVRVNQGNGKVAEVVSSDKPTAWLVNIHTGSNFIKTNSIVDREVWMAVVHSAKMYRNHLIEFE
jgi:hypothetical protein